jgi:hypothetical protein
MAMCTAALVAWNRAVIEASPSAEFGSNELFRSLDLVAVT